MSNPSPLPSQNNSSEYTLFYRKGNSVHTDWKNFLFKGDFRAAIERAKKHCETMGLKFIKISPALVNLDEEEKRHVLVEEGSVVGVQ